MNAPGFLIGLVALFGFIGVIYPTPWHKKLKIDKRWKALLVWLGASVLAAPFMPKDNSHSTAEAVKPVPVATQTAESTSATKPASKPAQEPEQKPKQWTKVIEFSGDQSNSPSDRFQLTGGDVKMVWEMTPENQYAKDMVVMGGSLNDTDNNPVQEFEGNTGQTKGEWKIYGVPAGTYYFKPNTVNGKYHCIIYELK